MNPADAARVELDLLIGLFFADSSQLGEFSEVTAAQMPQPQRDLLAHDQHMTVTIERFHGCQVDVSVLNTHVAQNQYSRKILLTRKSDDVVVQFGIVRLDLSVLDEAVRREIESEQTPLGRILIAHNVLRVVKLLSLYRIQAGPSLASALGTQPGDDCFGRTALIYCNGAPGVELLEIVGNVD